MGHGSESTGLHVQIGYRPVLASCCYGQIAYFETAVRSLVGKIPNNILDLGKRLYNARSFWCAGHFLKNGWTNSLGERHCPIPWHSTCSLINEDSTILLFVILLRYTITVASSQSIAWLLLFICRNNVFEPALFLHYIDAV